MTGSVRNNREPIRALVRLHDVEVMAIDLQTVVVRRTDQPADFGGFFSRHHDPVHRALSLTLGDTDLARDAAAEAMARAYERWSKVSTYDNPSGWVYRVGLNWATSRLRKRRREVGPLATEPTVFDPAVTDPALERALAELPVAQRAVVVLRYLLDWSELQTAAALDIAPGTVKSRLSRALAHLAAALEDPDGSR